MIEYSLNTTKVTERNIFFSEQVSQKSIKDIIEKIINFNDIDDANEELTKLNGVNFDRKPIKIYIDSYGGVVYQILGLISIIEKSKTPVYTYLTGCAMSCGFLLLISGHKRFAYKYSTALYHQLSGGRYGKIQEIEENIIESQRLQTLLETITREKTKISKARLTELRKLKEDWYIPSDELVELGIVDKIL